MATAKKKAKKVAKKPTASSTPASRPRRKSGGDRGMIAVYYNEIPILIQPIRDELAKSARARTPEMMAMKIQVLTQLMIIEDAFLNRASELTDDQVSNTWANLYGLLEDIRS